MDFEITEAGPRGEISLIGSRCLDCGSHSFPTRASCSRCFGHNLLPLELTRLGRVERCTIVRQAPQGYFGPVPYVLGDVTLEDGVSVLTNLVGKPVEAWRPGDPVAAYGLRLPTQRSGDAAAECFCFRPRTAEDAVPRNSSSVEPATEER
jgi:uncharacterized OB-fold protein